jgi:hypothetical protein
VQRKHHEKFFVITTFFMCITVVIHVNLMARQYLSLNYLIVRHRKESIAIQTANVGIISVLKFTSCAVCACIVTFICRFPAFGRCSHCNNVVCRFSKNFCDCGFGDGQQIGNLPYKITPLIQNVKCRCSSTRSHS